MTDTAEKRITVYVAPSDALARGESTYGNLPIDLNATLALLTFDERKALGASDSGELTCTWANMYVDEGAVSMEPVAAISPTPADVAAAIRTMCKQVQAVKTEIAAEHARHRTIAETQLEQYVDKWRGDVQGLSLIVHKIQGQPPLSGAIEPTHPLYIEARDLFKAAKAHADGAEARRKAAAEQKHARGLAAFTAWALKNGNDDLKRAFANGYPVGSSIDHEIVARCFPQNKLGVMHTYGVSEKGERPVPDTKAYALEKELREQCAEIEAAGMLPEGCAFIVGRILRLEIDQDSGVNDYGDDNPSLPPLKRTGIKVTMRAPHTSISRYYVTEKGGDLE